MRFTDAQIDELIELAHLALDDDERRDIVREALEEYARHNTPVRAYSPTANQDRALGESLRKVGAIR